MSWFVSTRPGAGHGETVQCLTVSSAPRALLRRGTKRDSRVDNGALPGTKDTDYSLHSNYMS